MTTDDVPFTDPCSRCGRPLWSDDGTCPNDGECYEIGGADCQLHGQLRDLRSQLRASEAECERLRREVEEWKENASKACETPVDGCDCSGCSYARECAAVEYLEKEHKDG